jgi:putative sigma-54 modulation protein
MRIQVKGRNVTVSEEIREHVAKRFEKVGRQVSELAELEVELSVERNPAIPDSQVAEATLYLKGVTLRAHDCSREMLHAINLCAEEMAVQVKRHRDKRRRRREARAAAPPPPVPVEAVLPVPGEAALPVTGDAGLPLTGDAALPLTGDVSPAA